MAQEPASEKSVFLRAIEMSVPNERAAYLQAACGTNHALRAEVEALLAAHSASQALLDATQPLDTQQAPAEPPAIDERPGSQIGPYKLLEEIGHGGMGVVYMADQQQPVRRRVALKIIKPGMDTRQVVARFEAERQALSLMDHPNIARVLDAGATATGRPYFVMELVKGQPITQYCDDHQLTPRQRLELMVPVCQAIQHAHQKGIIHRDIKPSNILVAEYDNQPVPKVIDFGVAKATSQPLTEKTMFTGFGQIVGTLEYMSPEQAKSNQLDVDTRSDIYALGVLLYELLTGTTPLDKKRLRSAAWDEMLRMIREDEPPRPSTRLSSIETLPSVAATRQTPPAKLALLLRGDLDWIVMRALDKDRARRYETASSLADDLRRYLQDEPVSAGPPSATYRLRKFVRRHKRPAAAVAVLLLALVTGAIGTSVGMVRARDAAALAEQRLRDVEAANAATTAALKKTEAANQATRAALVQSEASRQEAEAVTRYMAEILKSPDPSQDGRQVKVADVLDRAAERVETDFANAPQIQAKLFDSLGDTYRGLGLPAQALQMRRRQVAIAAQTWGADSPLTGVAQTGLGDALQFGGDFAAAIPVLREAARILEKAGPAEIGNLVACQIMLGKTLRESGRPEEGLQVLEAARQLIQPSPSSSSPHFSMSFAKEYGVTLVRVGRTAEGLRVMESALAPDQGFDNIKDPAALILANDLAVVYQEAGLSPNALDLLKIVYERQRELLSDNHPHTLVAAGNWALMAARAGGDPDQYLPVMRHVAERRSVLFGANHRLTLAAQVNLALGMNFAGQRRPAIMLLEELLPKLDEHLDPTERGRLTAMRVLAEDYYYVLRDTQRSESLFAKLLRIEEGQGERAAFTLHNTIDCMARIREDMGDFAQAIELRRRAIAECTRRIGPHELDTLEQREKLGRLLISLERYVEGLEEMRQTVEAARNSLGPRHLRTLLLMNSWAQCLSSAKLYAQAIAIHEETLRLQAETLGPENPLTLGSRSNIALNHWNEGQHELAIRWCESLLSEVTTETTATANELDAVRSNLAQFYAELKRFPEAVALGQQVVERKSKRFGPTHGSTRESRLQLAEVLLASGQTDAALQSLRDLNQQLGTGPESLREILSVRRRLAQALKRKGLRDECLALLDDTLVLAEAKLNVHNVQLLRFIDFASELNFDLQREPRGLELRRQIVARIATAPNVSQETRWKARMRLGLAEYFHGEETIGQHRLEELVVEMRAAPRPDPVILARAESALGGIYESLGERERATPLLEAAVTNIPDDTDENRQYLRNARLYLARLYANTNRPDDALRAVRAAIETAPRESEDSPESLLPLQEIEAAIVSRTEPVDQADARFKALVARSESTLGPQHHTTLKTVAAWANYLFDQKLFDRAEPLYERVIAGLVQADSSGSGPLLQVRSQLAAMYHHRQQFDQMAEQLELILAAPAEVQAANVAEVVKAKQDLGYYCWQNERYDRALRLYTEVYVAALAKYGPTAPVTVTARYNQAAQYLGLENFVLARDILVELLERLKPLERTPKTIDQVRTARQMLLAAAQGLADEKYLEQVLRESLAIEQQNGPAALRQHGQPLRAQLALCLARQGRGADAGKAFDEFWSELLAAPDQIGPEVIEYANKLGFLLWFRGQYRHALPIFERCLAAQTKELDSDDERLDVDRINIAAQLSGLKQYPRARTTLDDLLAAIRRRGKLPTEVELDVRARLIAISVEEGTGQNAVAELRQLIKDASLAMPGGDPLVAKCYARLCRLSLEQGRFDEARTAIDKALEARGAVDSPEFLDHYLHGLLGATQMAQSQQALGQELFRKSLEAMDQLRPKIPHANWESLPALAQIASQLCATANQAEQAAHWQKEAERWRNDIELATQ